VSDTQRKKVVAAKNIWH